MQAEAHCQEPQRLAALRGYEILDTPRERPFDELVALACSVFGAPIAVVNFIDSGRQWFKAEVGLGVRETPLETSFCAHALLQEDLLVVPDATQDHRFADNPLVTDEPNLRFYAGALLKTPNGMPLGTLCVLDYRTREFVESDREKLRVLANQVMAQLETRRLLKVAETAQFEAAHANRRLEKEIERKNTFLAVLAHELRGPLSPIGMVAGLLEQIDTPMAARCQKILERQVGQMDRLIEDLLDASRVSQGKISLDRQRVCFSQLVSQAIETVARVADDSNHRIQANVSETIISVDPVRMVQILSNLLTNAIRYTPPGGSINVTSGVEDGETWLEVTDNGQGITADDQEHIFDLFSQSDRNASSTAGGLGIGLNLVRNLVEMHGGAVTVFSAGPDTGSTFRITLPPP